MRNFNEFMNEVKGVNRWLVASVFVMGAFCGALLTVVFVWIGLI